MLRSPPAVSENQPGLGKKASLRYVPCVFCMTMYLHLIVSVYCDYLIITEHVHCLISGS